MLTVAVITAHGHSMYVVDSNSEEWEEPFPEPTVTNVPDIPHTLLKCLNLKVMPVNAYTTLICL